MRKLLVLQAIGGHFVVMIITWNYAHLMVRVALITDIDAEIMLTIIVLSSVCYLLNV